MKEHVEDYQKTSQWRDLLEYLSDDRFQFKTIEKTIELVNKVVLAERHIESARVHAWYLPRWERMRKWAEETGNGEVVSNIMANGTASPTEARPYPPRKLNAETRAGDVNSRVLEEMVKVDTDMGMRTDSPLPESKVLLDFEPSLLDEIDAVAKDRDFIAKGIDIATSRALAINYLIKIGLGVHYWHTSATRVYIQKNGSTELEEVRVK